MYNHEPTTYACPFCSLISGAENENVLSRPSDVIYHDQAVTAFIGSHQWPNNPGNVLVAPNQHFENLYDLPVNYAVDIHRVARMVALAQKAVYGCDGVSTRQHNEPGGSQDVWHYHLHVTPRYDGDEFYTSARELMPAEERASHAAKLRDYLARHPALVRSSLPLHYDVVFVGNYTKDTIVSGARSGIVDGGAFNYGAHVAAAMGMKVAAVTHLAREDWHVVDELSALGIDVLGRAARYSTCLRLEYPTADVDQRIIYVASSSDPIAAAEVKDLEARAYVVGSTMRGEVDLDVIEALAARNGILAVDVQGFVRVARDGILRHDRWPEKESYLRHVDVVKCDAIEARTLTGTDDMHQAARILADLGPKEVLLTHNGGVLGYSDGTYYEAGFVARELVGRSGRGDTCLAAYVARRLDHPPAAATVWAAAATSLKMEAEGPFRREPAEVEKLIQERY